MPTLRQIYIPFRPALTAEVSGNPILQLEHAGRVEMVGIEPYERRGVEGWTIHRGSGERVLIVPKRTTANPYGNVLLIPGADRLPESEAQLAAGWRWIRPKLGPVGAGQIGAACVRARESWREAFRFIEEERVEGEVVRAGLRPPQMGALFASLAHWKVTEEVGTIVMPTGTGKTETMLALLARERLERLLVIVPTKALRDQTADKFLTFGILPRFGIVADDALLPVVGKIEHQFLTAEDARRFLHSCNVVVATMSVVGQCSEPVQHALAEACTHLFIDEAHHAPARTWNEFRGHVQEQERPVLQFTATPFRRDGKHVGGRPIFTYPLRKAQEDGYFTPIKFLSIWEYNRDQADTAIARQAVRALREDLRAGHDHILMARTDEIKRADEVYRIYKDLAPDLAPLCVHSRQGGAEQAAALESIRNRRSRVIVCVDMLGEGFDLPQLKVAALHDVHKSLAITIQFAGRFTRAATGLGEATIIANAADANVEEALEDLYAKDSDWNLVLSRLSEGATGRQRKRSEFIRGFQNAPAGIPLQNVYPKMSTVVYRTTCDEWAPGAVRNLLGDADLIVEPTVNPTERVLLYITREISPVPWGETKSVQDLVHHLYLAFWDEQQKLLFIHSSNNAGTHLWLAKALAGDSATLIRGERVYRSLYGVNRLILSNLGLLHLLSRATQFTMHVGTDIREGLSRASVTNRKKSNLFSRGYEEGESVTIGASHKGRIWSQRAAEDVSEWVEWCRHMGAKLLDESISTDRILEHAIIPEEIDDRPNLVPLTVEWPPYFLERSEESVEVRIGAESVPFYQAALEVTTFSESGPLCFQVSIGDVHAEYQVAFRGNSVEYLPTGKAVVYISAAGRTATLTEWFQEEYPVITFEDTSKLEYNEIFRPKRDREPFDSSKIEAWDWTGVALTRESQYKAHKDSRDLQLRKDSIQHCVIERLRDGYAGEHDIIFDDDGAGEIADIVTLRAAGDSLLVRLFHCKFAKSHAAGVRVGDFYEVCGQAQKSVYWRSDVRRLFERLKLREMDRQKAYSVARFERGDLLKLDELRRRSRVLRPKFEIYIVQPGLDVERVSTEVLDLLGATELYLRETFDVPLIVIGS